ncbi:hypothetical protein LUZ62_036841 [Rhynchospora pubera]|uniref:Uncharacterized protein n=1 Tax=Rhynchospora pubera TaxID=906938 RepID=A0AAV8F1R4_9POAL|nr:hypothetical protein LUZ62_036841 [Rhynchospora pubera]
MEESKAAAYYDELTRKGEGAARFKQGLGFSSSSSSSSSTKPPPPPPSSSSSFLSSFVRAGEHHHDSGETERREREKDRNRDISSRGSTGKAERREQLNSIKNKLSRKPNKDSRDRDSREERREERGRDIERERSRDRDRERDRHRERDRDRDRQRNRDGDRYDRDRNRDRRSDRYERSRSPSRRERERRRENENRNKSGKVDYAELIPGYDRMTPAERVKAKTKLQLSETAAKDPTKGMAKGWERFNFDKDAPLDNEDEEIEAADDDASIMKDIGKSFRFSAVEAKREDEIRKAHDEAMFGGSTLSVSHTELTDFNISREDSDENINSEDQNGILNDTNSLVNDKIFAMQPGSWRDRVRKPRDDAK